MPNISSKSWPFIRGNDKYLDWYFVYDLSKRKRGDYLNIWRVYSHLGKNDIIYSDKVITLKAVDEITSINLYRKRFNPVSINICCPVGAKFDFNSAGDRLYLMKATIHSIDDSSYGIWWSDLTLSELKLIRLELMKWVDLFSSRAGRELNGERFLDRCVELGANFESKDYN